MTSVKINRRTVLALPLFVFLLLFSSCSQSDDVSSRSELMSQLILKFSGLSPKTPGTGNENKIDRLRILIFDNTTEQIEVNDYFDATTSPALGSLPAISNWTLSKGTKYIAVIGNEETAQKSTFDAMTNLTQLKAMTISTHVNISLNSVTGRFPFYSYKVLSLQQNTANIDISLDRAMSKIIVQIKKDASVTSVVSVKSMQYLNVVRQTNLIEDLPLTSANADSFGAASLSTTLTNSYQDIRTNFFYYYGCIPTTTYIPQIKLGIEVNGVLKSYTIPLICGTDTNGAYIYGIKRNTYAQMYISYVGDEILKVTYDNMPWNDQDDYDKDINKDDSNLIFGEWGTNPAFDVGL